MNLRKGSTSERPWVDAAKIGRTSSYVGWKAADSWLHTNDWTLLRFAPLHSPLMTDRYLYGTGDEMAVCSMYRTHDGQAPVDGCGCGFNAWESSRVAVDYLADTVKNDKVYQGIGPYRISDYPTRLAILRVVLFGNVIEGTLTDNWGYRASRQNVVDVFIEKICTVCGQEADCLGAIAPADGIARHLLLRPLCADHHDVAKQRFVTIPMLERRNNITFHWNFPSE